MKLRQEFLVFTVILIVSKISGEETKVCLKCDDCLTVPTATDGKTCTPTIAKCYTKVGNDGKIERGCLTDAIPCDDKDKSCRSCDASTTSCNAQTETKDLFWCTTCNSSTNANCANILKSNPNNFCPAGVTRCLSQINEKNTIRGCASKSDDKCADGVKCSACDERGCNSGLFPSDRRKCYQCNDATCATPTTDKSYACQMYEESDSCYEYGTSDTAMIRGCKSDKSEYEKCPSGKCKVCTTNDCNNDTFKRKQTIKCIQCSSETDPKCSGVHTEDEAKDCKDIEYWQSEGCYLNRVGSGKVVRGCLQEFDSTKTCSETNTCSPCEAKACNLAALLELSCYKCRSDRNNKCADKLEKDEYKSEPCRNKIENEEDKKCYVENYNGVVYRSCIVDTDPKTREKCLKKVDKSCVICDGSDCNKDKAPGSAYGIALASGLLAGCLLILQFF